MKLIITGGRFYSDRQKLYGVIDTLRETENIELIVQGGASGADALALEYAVLHKIPHETYKADWKDLSFPDARIKTNAYGQYDAQAGHRRNELMCKLHPDATVVAFKGNHGTRDCIETARRLGLKVIDTDQAHFSITQNVTATERLVFNGKL